MDAGHLTNIADVAREAAPAIVGSALILLYWAWALAGRRAFLRNGMGHLVGRRQRAAGTPLLVLAGLAFVGHFATGSRPLTVAIGLLATGVFVRFVARDPFRQGFWHHRRIRTLVSLTLAFAGLALAVATPWPWLVPVIVATMLFHRHMSLTASLLAAQLEDLDAVRAKLATLEAREMIARAVLSAPAAPARTSGEISAERAPQRRAG